MPCIKSGKAQGKQNLIGKSAYHSLYLIVSTTRTWYSFKRNSFKKILLWLCNDTFRNYTWVQVTPSIVQIYYYIACVDLQTKEGRNWWHIWYIPDQAMTGNALMHCYDSSPSNSVENQPKFQLLDTYILPNDLTLNMVLPQLRKRKNN